jgi:hypothetical protein
MAAAARTAARHHRALQRPAGLRAARADLERHRLHRRPDPGAAQLSRAPIAEETFALDEGGFAYLPSEVPHAFVNLTDAPAEIIVVYTPGGGHRFYEELGPATRNGTPDRAVVAAIFEKHDMSLLGPPLSAD